tara:strand:- start:800 stop:1798 length:999 start_codon:yes stop_codon:yes gene_type:complete
MAVKWTKAYETSTTGDMPTTSAVNWSQGFTVQSGNLEFLTLRYDMTFGATPVGLSDVSALIDSLRIIVNGEVAHDFTAGKSNTAADPILEQSQYNYLLNKIGGRVVEVCDESAVATRVGYINIPLGRVLNSTGQNRIECIVGWAPTDAAATITSGKLEWWCRYNDAAETMTTVVPATSFTHSASLEQVIVRCPTNLPAGSTISAILCLNDSQADELGSQGIRILSLSDYGITPDQWRMINSDLMNGIEYNAGGTAVGDALTYKQVTDGSLLIPTFNLSLGDVALMVDSSAATTRKYFPIITTPIGGRQKTEQVQTARLAGNTSKAILSNDLQ